MARILHSADWQIGRQFAAFDVEDGVLLAEARLAVVERIALLASEERVDAVVVAGDVFDAQAVSERTIRRLFLALGGYQGAWVIIPGNHDAALAESVWTHAARLGVIPPNVHVALEREVVPLAAARVAFLCAPLTQRHTYDDLTAWFDAAETPAGWWRVGVAHGAVQGVLSEGIDSPNPIAPDRARAARLDYLALGDWHGTRRIDERTWYSGTPEPDRFRANDAGNVLLVDLDLGVEPRVRSTRVARHTWRQATHDLRVPSDVDALLAALEVVGADDVLDLTVTGHVDLALHTRVSDGLRQAEARARCTRADTTGLRIAPTDADIAALRADGYLGEVIAELRAVTVPDARRAQDALELLTALLSKRTAP